MLVGYVEKIGCRAQWYLSCFREGRGTLEEGQQKEPSSLPLPLTALNTRGNRKPIALAPCSARGSPGFQLKCLSCPGRQQRGMEGAWESQQPTECVLCESRRGCPCKGLDDTASARPPTMLWEGHSIIKCSGGPLRTGLTAALVELRSLVSRGDCSTPNSSSRGQRAAPIHWLERRLL